MQHIFADFLTQINKTGLNREKIPKCLVSVGKGLTFALSKDKEIIERLRKSRISRVEVLKGNKDCWIITKIVKLKVKRL